MENLPATAEEQTPRYAMQLSTAQEARAIAEVKAALTVAQAAPRSPMVALNRIRMACQRTKLAASASYQYNRGGTDVTGPSIRLAEALAQNWGNIDFGWREISSDNGESLVETYAWDLETNTRRVTQFKVPHTRYTKKNGNTPLVDPRDIYEMVANNAARRMRACVLAVIPADIVEEALAICNTTLNATFDGKKVDCIKSIMADYEGIGVTQKQLEVFVGRNLSSISAAQYINLQRIFTSINDGLAKAENWFAPIEANQGLDGGMGQIETKAPPPPKSPPPPVKEEEPPKKQEPVPKDEPAPPENHTETQNNGAPAPKTDMGNTSATENDEKPASDAPTATEPQTFEELLAYDADLRQNANGDAEIKEARIAIFGRLPALRKAGFEIPLPSEHPVVFFWLLANGGPISVIKDAWQELIQTEAYKRLTANDKASIAGKYRNAVG